MTLIQRTLLWLAYWVLLILNGHWEIAFRWRRWPAKISIQLFHWFKCRLWMLRHPLVALEQNLPLIYLLFVRPFFKVYYFLGFQVRRAARASRFITRH